MRSWENTVCQRKGSEETPVQPGESSMMTKPSYDESTDEMSLEPDYRSIPRVPRYVPLKSKFLERERQKILKEKAELEKKRIRILNERKLKWEKFERESRYIEEKLKDKLILDDGEDKSILHDGEDKSDFDDEEDKSNFDDDQFLKVVHWLNRYNDDYERIFPECAHQEALESSTMNFYAKPASSEIWVTNKMCLDGCSQLHNQLHP